MNSATVSEQKGIVYNGLLWEPRAYRRTGEAGKALLTYDKHEARLKSDDWERAPTADEFFGLICDYLDGNIKDKGLAALVEDALNDFGEHCCQASKRKGNIWTVFNYATGLRFDEKDSEHKKPRRKWYENKISFNIRGLGSGYHSLEEVNKKNPEIIKPLYSKEFDKLPIKIKKNGGINIPDDERVWPVGRGHFYDGRFDINGCNYDDWASRGVSRAEKN